MTETDANTATPDDIVAALHAAIALHQQGDVDAAAARYRAVLDQHPDHPDALHFLGMAEYAKGNREEAKTLIHKSIDQAPTNVAAHNNLGNILLAMDDEEAAADAYTAVATLEPENPIGYQNLGVVLRRMGRNQDARAVLSRAITLKEDYLEAWHNLGIVNVLLGDHEGAAEAFERAVALNTNGRLDTVWLSRVLCAMGRADTALEHLHAHLEKHPDDAVARHHVAALTGNAPERAEADYVRTHFDDFANSFDDTLKSLNYRAPEIVAEEVARWTGDRGPWPKVIDLGCGTGLLGPHVKAHCGELIGIDLSPQMLIRAADVGAYHVLIEDDLVGYLNGLDPASVDLALAADTLCYLGVLDEVMVALGRCLKPGAALIATYEEAPADVEAAAGYHLDSHGRYSHTMDYLGRVAEAGGLTITQKRAEVLRREVGEDVAGLIVTMERTA